MYIGTCKIQIRIPENQNLKGKRRIINSLRDRLRNEFNIAIAEIDNQDVWQLATLGVACVSNDPKNIEQLLAKFQNYLLTLTGEFEIINTKQEIIAGI